MTPNWKLLHTLSLSTHFWPSASTSAPGCPRSGGAPGCWRGAGAGAGGSAGGRSRCPTPPSPGRGSAPRPTVGGAGRHTGCSRLPGGRRWCRRGGTSRRDAGAPAGTSSVTRPRYFYIIIFYFIIIIIFVYINLLYIKMYYTGMYTSIHQLIRH